MCWSAVAENCAGIMHLSELEKQMQTKKQEAEYQKTLNEIKQNLSKDDKKLSNLLSKLEEQINNNSPSALNSNKDNKTSKKKEPSIFQQNNGKIPFSEEDQKEIQKQISDIKVLKEQVAEHFENLESNNLGEYAQVSLFQNSAFLQLQVLNLSMYIKELESKIAEHETKIDKLEKIIGINDNPNEENSVMDALHDASSYLIYCIQEEYMNEQDEENDEEKIFPTEAFTLCLKKSQKEIDEEIKNLQQFPKNTLSLGKRTALRKLKTAKNFRPTFENLLNALGLSGKESAILRLKVINDQRNLIRHKFSDIDGTFNYEEFSKINENEIQNEELRESTKEAKELMVILQKC